MKRSLLSYSSICIAAVLYSAAPTPASAQLVNGGFETGDFTGWTVNDPSDFTNVGSNPAFSYSGTSHANLGATGLLGTLTQSFNTVAGGTYTVSFALANDGQFAPNQFDILWNGAVVFSLVDAPFSGSYTLYSVSNLVAPTSSTTLQVRYQNDADYFRLDDVTASVVPEPATMSFLLLGVGLLSVSLYSKNTRARSRSVERGSNS